MSVRGRITVMCSHAVVLPGWLPCTKGRSILINNLSVKARTPGCSTSCAHWQQQISYLLFLIVSGNMGHFFLSNMWNNIQNILEFGLFSKNLFEFACVFAIPGKAVRREIRTAPANISTTRSSVVSPERPRGEANAERNSWHPVKCTRSAHHSTRLHSAPDPTPRGDLQSRQRRRRRQFERKDVGGDWYRRKCVFKCNFQWRLHSTHFLSQFLRSEVGFLWVNVPFSLLQLLHLYLPDSFLDFFTLISRM